MIFVCCVFCSSFKIEKFILKECILTLCFDTSEILLIFIIFISCKTCTGGKYHNQNARETECKVCIGGKYQGQNGQSACKTCDVGKTTGGYVIKHGNTKCTDTVGMKVITTREECWQAREKLGVGGGYSGNTNNGYSGSWSHLPTGCSNWNGNVHFNTYGSSRSCTYSYSQYCLCAGKINCSKMLFPKLYFTDNSLIFFIYFSGQW